MAAVTAPAAGRMIPPPPGYDRLLDAALETLPGAAAAGALRRASLARFQSIGLPGAKAEAWKYSPVAGLAREAMAPAPAVALDRARLAPWLIDQPRARHLVFVNGHFDPTLSDGLSDGLAVRPLAAALAASGDQAGRLLREDATERGFNALNAAFASGGAVIELADGGMLDGPIQLLFVHVGTQDPAMVNVRNLITLGASAALDLVETHVVEGEGRQLVNSVSRVALGEGASLRHDRLQLGAVAGSLIGRTEYRLASDARLVQTLATFGGAFVRNEIDAVLDGSAIEAQFNGLYLTRDGQHVDNMLRIEHARPGSHSDQFYKGVLDGRAQAAFAGKIVVQRPAQKTNAYQSNNNLLLSPDAEINTKPELEIFADDVKCSHGATAGELDERELFYLRSRGLDLATARSMMTFAFAGAVLERFADPTAMHQAKRELLRWLPGGAALDELLA
jgi:Fe-S cluster assembly protein SufD